MEEVDQNTKIHDQMANSYDTTHSEIYNGIEQKRLAKLIASIVEKSTETHPNVLDFGSGTGNLTVHFLTQGAKVTAADVSLNSLKVVKEKLGDQVETTLINGEDLSNIQNNTFDIVAMYSVLHHIPNYLGAIGECMRVLKPGGFLYIDHEHSQEYRSNKESFNDLYSSTDQKTLLEKIVHLVTSPRLFLKHCTIRRKRLFDKRYQYEGDIHVRDDDHIQREKISMVVSEFGELYKSQTYLLYRKGFDMNQYLGLKNSQHDMQRSLYRKNVL